MTSHKGYCFLWMSGHGRAAQIFPEAAYDVAIFAPLPVFEAMERFDGVLKQDCNTARHRSLSVWRKIIELRQHEDGVLPLLDRAQIV